MARPGRPKKNVAEALQFNVQLAHIIDVWVPLYASLKLVKC